jgi:hypothetical protein
LLNFDVAKLAFPLCKVAVPSAVFPVTNLIVPTGVPAPSTLAETVAVKVTFCPKIALFALLENEMRVPL